MVFWEYFVCVNAQVMDQHGLSLANSLVLSLTSYEDTQFPQGYDSRAFDLYVPASSLSELAIHQVGDDKSGFTEGRTNYAQEW